MTPKKLGRYDLLRVLGKGAMGLVYEGRDPNLERRVAIKTIRVENLSEEAAAEYEVRFRTEARSAARLQHPNIVSVYDSDRDGDIAFLVMEFIQGDDLKHHLDMGDRHTLEQTLGIMGDLLSALDYAHRQNIVHRDIKPANLLIEASGRVKLTDFGVARIQDAGDVTRTQGSMVGTLKYMSPEQVQGQKIDSRADLFAAGVVLYQLLTGKRPFDGDSDFAIIQQIVAHQPAAPSSLNPKLPPAIDAVVARVLAKLPKERFASGEEFAAALRKAAEQAFDPTAVAPPSQAPSPRTSTWSGTVRAGESLLDTRGGTGTSASAVTQELELVYWKDVKDSSDVEDLEGFLARFPGGIYTALARRRLRKLGVTIGDDSSMGSQTGAAKPAMSAASMQAEKTLLLRNFGSSGIAHPTPERVDSAWDALGAAAGQAEASSPAPHSRTATPESVASTIPPEPLKSETAAPAPLAQASETVPAAAPASRPWAWVLAAVVALAGAGVVFKQLSGPSSDASSLQSAGRPSSSASGAPAMTGTGEAPTAAADPVAKIDEASPALSASSSARLPGTVALAPSAPASNTLAAARKATSEKERQTKVAPANTAPALSHAEPAITAAEPLRATRAAAAYAPPPPIAPVQAANPRQACEDRKLFAFQSCMTEQCAKPAFASNPECVERHNMEQRRREVEHSR